MPDTALKIGPKLAERTGACGAVRCSCSAYRLRPAGRDTTWPTCSCGHTQHIHEPEGGV